MKTDIQITILVDNIATRPDIQAEHGLSLWIEYGTKHILWDTGQSDMLLANAKTLSIDLTKTDIIALSHGHYDHTGGLPAVTALAPKAPIYVHPAATVDRYSQKETVHTVAMPQDAVRVLNTAPVTWVESWTQIDPGVFVTGPIPRHTAFEDTGGAFFLDADCRVPDTLPDDQALVLESARGLIVILGCAHSGVVNTLDYVSRKTGCNQIHAVIGGMHLGKALRQRLDSTIHALRLYHVQCIVPLHCTGTPAAQYLQNVLSEKTVRLAQSPRLEWI